MTDAPDSPLREPTTRSWTPWIPGAALVACGLLALGLLVAWSQTAPRSVRPVVWDKQTCALCKMAISDPSFAAQLQTEDGRVLDFDDPGCLMSYLAEEQPEVRALYFHALEGDDWLTRDRVVFRPGARSPMGFDLGAVPRGTPGALSFEQTFQTIRESRTRPEGRQP
ncbi:MAG: hypothetical protein ABI353_00160 [Isosphaeraceae bacterium]